MPAKFSSDLFITGAFDPSDAPGERIFDFARMFGPFLGIFQRSAKRLGQYIDTLPMAFGGKAAMPMRRCQPDRLARKPRVPILPFDIFGPAFEHFRYVGAGCLRAGPIAYGDLYDPKLLTVFGVFDDVLSID